MPNGIFQQNLQKRSLSSFAYNKFHHKFWTNNFDFLEIFSQKMTLPNESRTNEYLHRIFRIRISLGTKFQFKPTSLIFWTKFAQKEYFRSTTEKVNITSEFCMFELVLLPNVNLNYFKFWYQICPKRVFLVEKEKFEHWVLHIWFNLTST